jgi:hypothetical protein
MTARKQTGPRRVDSAVDEPREDCGHGLAIFEPLPSSRGRVPRTREAGPTNGDGSGQESI